MNYNSYIDHTLLKQNSTKEQIDTLLKEAIEFQFKSVCVNPYWVSYCKNALKDHNVLVCTVIGFPLGANTIDTKVFETKDALSKGADEIDMVINIGALKPQDYQYLVKEIKAIKDVCQDHTLKVIIETCLLDEDEKRMACKAIMEAKADFVKTSTGFSTSGATIEDVKLLKSCVLDHCLIKAAGGVRSFDDLEKMIEVGANRIGTSSGVLLMNQKDAKAGY